MMSSILYTALIIGGAQAENSKLLPEGEAELVSPRPVQSDSARFVAGKGLEFKSEDGDFKLQTRIRAQYLYTGTSQADEAYEPNFMIRRARLQFGGNMWGKHNKFKAELSFAPRDVSNEAVDFDGNDVDDSNVVKTSPLLDWYTEFTYFRDLRLRVGQYKLPYSRQRVISSGNLQLVDRSTTANAEFTLDRDLGLDLRSKDLFGLDKLRYYAGVYIGEGRNTSNKTMGAGDQGLLYIGRVEIMPFGSFDDYSEADLKRNSELGVSLGLAYAYLSDAPKDRGILGSSINPDDVWNYTNMCADLMVKYGGFSLLSEAFARQGESELGAPTKDGWGAMAQAGYLLPQKPIEIAARYGLNRRIGSESESTFSTELNEAGGGLGYYMARHPFKVQADVFRSWNEADGQELGQTTFRMQLQAAL